MRYLALIPLLFVPACAELESLLVPTSAPVAAMPETPPVVETLDPTPAPPPPPQARTVEQFDTTSAEDRAEALAAPETAAETALGTTIASLGSPTIPGIWLETPLVDTLVMGRVAHDGQSVNLELRPSGGPAGSGSQLSLAAMRLLDVPLTDLPEIEVFQAP